MNVDTTNQLPGELLLGDLPDAGDTDHCCNDIDQNALIAHLQHTVEKKTPSATEHSSSEDDDGTRVLITDDHNGKQLNESDTIEIELNGVKFSLNVFEPLQVVEQSAITTEEPHLKEQQQDDSCYFFSKPKQKRRKSRRSLILRKRSGVAAVVTQTPPAIPKSIITIDEELGEQINLCRPDMPENYVWKKLTNEEEYSRIEYDLEEEDFTWLEIVGKRSSAICSRLSEDILEFLIDRFEKNCAFLGNVRSGNAWDAVDEEARCVVCLDDECNNSNAIIFCDRCDMPVHQDCYGVPFIPTGEWLCQRCLISPSRSQQCVLCTSSDGALKQTVDGDWVHVVCVLWIPEMYFLNPVYFDPAASVSILPADRKRLVCSLCAQHSKVDKRQGACVQCSGSAYCFESFHVTCAQSAGYFMELAGSNSDAVSVYCPQHTPLSSLDCHNLSGKVVLDEDHPKEALKKAQKMRRDMYSEVVSKMSNPSEKTGMRCEPVVSVEDQSKIRLELTERTSETIDSKSFRRVYNYWRLKRNYRNGAPLIRRLQYQTKRVQALCEKTGQHWTSEDGDTVESEPGLATADVSEEPAMTLAVKSNLEEKVKDEEEEDDDDDDEEEEEHCDSELGREQSSTGHADTILAADENKVSESIQVHTTFQQEQRRRVSAAESMMTNLTQTIQPSTSVLTLKCASEQWSLAGLGRIDSLPTDTSKTAAGVPTDVEQKPMDLSHPGSVTDAHVVSIKEDIGFRLLRQSMEKLRLLLQLVIKREKLKHQILKLELGMFERGQDTDPKPADPEITKQVRAILIKFKSLDQRHIFTNPVTEKIAPRYLEIIKSPICLRDMWSKRNTYASVHELSEDINLMLANCTQYNSSDTFVYKYGKQIEAKFREVFRIVGSSTPGRCTGKSKILTRLSHRQRQRSMIIRRRRRWRREYVDPKLKRKNVDSARK